MTPLVTELLIFALGMVILVEIARIAGNWLAEALDA